MRNKRLYLKRINVIKIILPKLCNWAGKYNFITFIFCMFFQNKKVSKATDQSMQGILNVNNNIYTMSLS